MYIYACVNARIYWLFKIHLQHSSLPLVSVYNDINLRE